MKTIIKILIFLKLTMVTNIYAESIYDIKINTIDGDETNLKSFKGKKILIVNVASKCGFTKQYSQLEELYKTYKKKLVVIGVPCNQFGGQEPGTTEEIVEYEEPSEESIAPSLLSKIKKELPSKIEKLKESK